MNSSDPPAAAPVGAGRVVAVSRDDQHRFSKGNLPEITLVTGWGVEGDAHAGGTVEHRSRAAREPAAVNLRQVHLIHEELFHEVAAAGYTVAPGELGENITTAGVPLLELPTGTVLRLGPEAAVELTGLRNPCWQIDGLAPGLMKQMVTRRDDGTVVRKAGVMSVVRRGGLVRPGDTITVQLPQGSREPLRPV